MSNAPEKGVNGDSIEWQDAIKWEMTPYDGAVTVAAMHVGHCKIHCFTRKTLRTVNARKEIYRL